MALTGELTYKGLTISNAYLRVMEVTHRAVDSPSTTLYADYSARIYKDVDARTAGDDAITTISGSFTPSVANSVNLNIVKQTYTHLKTLADYDELTDDI
jgi:hypothetical protein